MHIFLREFLFITTFLSVFCKYNFNINHYDITPTKLCLTKILKKCPFRSTFRVVLEKNISDIRMEVLQDEIFGIFNSQAKWLVDIVELNEKQIEFVSEHSVTPTMVEYILLLLGDFDTFEEKLDDLLLNKQIFRGFELVVVLLTELDANYEDNVKELIQIAWDRKLLSTTVVTQTNISHEWYVYTSRYLNNVDKMQRCTKYIIPQNSLRCYNDSVTIMSYPHLWYSKSKYACTLDVISFEYPPFVINETSGFEVQLIQTLGKHININFEFLIENNSDTNWGELNKSDETWSGRLGQVVDKCAVAVGNLRATPDLQRFFEFSDAYYYDKMVWVVPVAELAPTWMCIFMPFSYHLWLFIIFIFLAGSILLRLSYVEKETYIYQMLDRTLFISLEIFLALGTKKLPITRITRATFISLTFCSMFVCSIYQSYLIDVLTHPIYQHQINSLEEVVQSGLNIGGSKQHKTYFNVTNDKASMKIYNMFKCKTNTSVYDWLQIVATERNTATVASELYVKYLIASGDPAVVINGFPKVYILNEVVIPVTTSILMPRRFPLKERINKGIRQMITNGVAKKLTRGATNKVKKFESRKEVVFKGKQVLALTIDNLQGAFILLLLGYLCAILMFLIELFIQRFKIFNKWIIRKKLN